MFTRYSLQIIHTIGDSACITGPNVICKFKRIIADRRNRGIYIAYITLLTARNYFYCIFANLYRTEKCIN